MLPDYLYLVRDYACLKSAAKIDIFFNYEKVKEKYFVISVRKWSQL